MTVHGTEKRDVIVEVTSKECLSALCKEAGVYNAIYPGYGVYWEETKKNGNIVGLKEYRDESRHGSPDYTPTGKNITNEDQIAAYVHLKALAEIFNHL